jgi:hypothetical protein
MHRLSSISGIVVSLLMSICISKERYINSACTHVHHLYDVFSLLKNCFKVIIFCHIEILNPPEISMFIEYYIFLSDLSLYVLSSAG